MKNIIVNIIVSTLFWNNVYSQCSPTAGLDANACGYTYDLQGILSQPGSTALWTSSYPGSFFVDASEPSTTVIIPSFIGNTLDVNFVFTETNTGSNGV